MEKWQAKAEELFGEALDLPREQRGAFLDAACPGAPDVRRAVESLLAENDRLSGFLSESPYKQMKDRASTGTAAHLLEPRTRLGRYLILEPLGSGGMGVVYRARDEKLERVVAIKMLAPGVLSGEEARRHFRREALALAKLNHPRIAAVYDVGEQDGADYIVMELVEGESLAVKLQAGALGIQEATAIALQVAEALEEAHAHGVIHRDLKPANVMITPKGNAKVLDFGVAKMLALDTDATASLTETGGLLGTPLYMSPEQALGRKVDARTDLWSLGVLYYESLAGRPPFQGSGSLAILHAITGQRPTSLREIQPHVPVLAEHIVTRALEKDCELRYQHAADLRTDLQRLIRDSSRSPWDASSPGQEQRDTGEPQPVVAALASKSKPRKLYYAAAAVLVLAIAAGRFLFHRASPVQLPDSKEWEQLTFFTDSAVYPALSSDGRMLAFIRGDDSFMGTGQIYVKLLPGGEPVPLTHDSKFKLAPSFSPDNSRIAYGVAGPWETWEVPVLGGEPHLLLPNSSSLTWIDGGKRLLFSEIKEGLHMAVVTTDEGRGDSRDVYVPPGQRSMAHHSYLSPDGQSVLIAQMGSQGEFLPCRVVPFQGTGDVRVVGPPNRECHSGAWSPDGKWIYLSVNTDAFHIWRQRFPQGQPEQLTFGPTSQEGIAMAPDGKSLITAVGSEDSMVWMHDKDGDHQISSEGFASSPQFSSDGRKLYFLLANGQTRDHELWSDDLVSGKMEQVLKGYPMENDPLMQNYSISRDGKEVAFVMKDKSGRSSLWIAPTSRRSSPVHLSSAAVEDSPFFLPNGDLIFRAIEGGSNFIYRMKADGTARRKITPEYILDINSVSPDGRWVVAASSRSSDEDNPASVRAFAVDGSAAEPVCFRWCYFRWDTTGKSAYLFFPGLSQDTYSIPVIHDLGLPKIPPAGFAGIEDIPNAKTNAAIPWFVESALSRSVYAYSRVNTRRNLYRIPLP
jgi:serine/threonine protein kinase/WD40 repeat protein